MRWRRRSSGSGWRAGSGKLYLEVVVLGHTGTEWSWHCGWTEHDGGSTWTQVSLSGSVRRGRGVDDPMREARRCAEEAVAAVTAGASAAREVRRG